MVLSIKSWGGLWGVSMWQAVFSSSSYKVVKLCPQCSPHYVGTTYQLCENWSTICWMLLSQLQLCRQKKPSVFTETGDVPSSNSFFHLPNYQTAQLSRCNLSKGIIQSITWVIAVSRSIVSQSCLAVKCKLEKGLKAVATYMHCTAWMKSPSPWWKKINKLVNY